MKPIQREWKMKTHYFASLTKAVSKLFWWDRSLKVFLKCMVVMSHSNYIQHNQIGYGIFFITKDALGKQDMGIFRAQMQMSPRTTTLQ